MIYFDNNATTPIDPDVAAEIQTDWNLGPSNASSQHSFGQRAQTRLDHCEETILEMIHGSDHRLVVTSGGTESNNWAIALLGKGTGSVVVSEIEHPSVLQAAKRLESSGHGVRYLPVDSSGVVQLDPLRQVLDEEEKPRLVSVMMANNETGVIQPIAEIAQYCNEADVPVHSDISQVIGKLPFDMDRLGLAAATISPHKFHGPVGIGALVLNRHASISPLITGGAQQLGRRGGTEPIAMVSGMSKAIELACDGLEQTYAEMLSRRQSLEDQLTGALPSIKIHGKCADRLPQTTCFSLPGLDRQALLMRLDLAGVACSTGSACASGSSQPSHVLLASGCQQSEVESAIRVSVSRMNTQEEVDELVCRIINCCNKLQ